MTKTIFDLPETLDIAEFISQEAHDLKSPYNRILGFIKLVLKGMDGPLTDMQKEDLTTAYNNVSYSFLLVSNLVDMARLSRSEKKTTFEDVEIQTLLEQSISYYNKMGTGKTPDLAGTNAAPEASLRADAALMRQAVAHCIAYATEYLQDQARVRVHVDMQGDLFNFSVSGEGTKNIAAAACDLTMYAYIVKQIVELHGGHIHTAEGDETSATLAFTLPKI